MNLTMNSIIIELSVHACNFVLNVLHREEVEVELYFYLNTVNLSDKIIIIKNYNLL